MSVCSLRRDDESNARLSRSQTARQNSRPHHHVRGAFGGRAEPYYRRDFLRGERRFSLRLARVLEEGFAVPSFWLGLLNASAKARPARRSRSSRLVFSCTYLRIASCCSSRSLTRSRTFAKPSRNRSSSRRLASGECVPSEEDLCFFAMSDYRLQQSKNLWVDHHERVIDGGTANGLHIG
jgi:hypothetical protein